MQPRGFAILHHMTEARPLIKVSRSKIDLFTRCPRCFYLDVKLKIGRPRMAPFTLNNAVDFLLKREFDTHRARGSKHPLFEAYGLDLVPFAHEKMDVWRENFQGVRFTDPETNLLLTGAVDDIWVSPSGELHVVDYKATAKDTVVDKLDDTEWHDQYRRQMEFYQWLLRKNGFPVSDTGYFVYVNGQKDRKAFDAKLEFSVAVIPYEGNDAWVEKTLVKARACLDNDKPPKAAAGCEYCDYRTRAGKALQILLLPAKEKKERKEIASEEKSIPPSTLF